MRICTNLSDKLTGGRKSEDSIKIIINKEIMACVELNMGTDC
jgi:hypothetical protein